MLAVKAVKQNIQASGELLGLLETFRRMVNDSIRIGLASNISSLKSLPMKAYHQLIYQAPSYYKLCAVSAASGILRNYRKAKRKNPNVKQPYMKKLILTTCMALR